MGFNLIERSGFTIEVDTNGEVVLSQKQGQETVEIFFSPVTAEAAGIALTAFAKASADIHKANGCKLFN